MYWAGLSTLKLANARLLSVWRGLKTRICVRFRSFMTFPVIMGRKSPFCYGNCQKGDARGVN